MMGVVLPDFASAVQEVEDAVELTTISQRHYLRE
jgi:hypothetical protein